MSIHCRSKQDGEVCMELSVLCFEVSPAQKEYSRHGRLSFYEVDSFPEAIDFLNVLFLGMFRMEYPVQGG